MVTTVVVVVVGVTTIVGFESKVIIFCCFYCCNYCYGADFL